MDRLPERVPGPGRLVLRRLTPADAEPLGRAVSESLEHLRPWMPWVAQEPLELERRRAMIGAWERGWRRGGDIHMAVLVDGAIAGVCGAHDRIGPGGLELGYWVHAAFLRRGVASGAVAALSAALLELPHIDHVEIQHDRANGPSGGVAAKAGFEVVDERPSTITAPAETGVSCRWRMTEEAWRERS